MIVLRALRITGAVAAFLAATTWLFITFTNLLEPLAGKWSIPIVVVAVLFCGACAIEWSEARRKAGGEG